MIQVDAVAKAEDVSTEDQQVAGESRTLRCPPAQSQRGIRGQRQVSDGLLHNK